MLRNRKPFIQLQPFGGRNAYDMNVVKIMNTGDPCFLALRSCATLDETKILKNIDVSPRARFIPQSRSPKSLQMVIEDITINLQRVSKILETLYAIWPSIMFPRSSAFPPPPPPPLIKVANSATPCSKLWGTTLKRGEGGAVWLSHRFRSSSVLEKERMFLIANVSTILQLVVAWHAVYVSY